MHYIVLDLEATCWEKRDRQPNEIIEIGAVAVNEHGEIMGEFSSFVKPQVHPELSAFCTQLTSISQEMVDSAPAFPEVLRNFLQWIESFDKDYMLCSWGFYDRQQFRNDCRLHQIDSAWTNRHISLKHQYEKIGAARKLMGMASALRFEKIPLQGTHHRGIDDARNITQIFLRHFTRWQYSA